MQQQQMINTLIINGRKYDIHGVIGRGSNGNVYLAEDNSKIKYAIKYVSYNQLHCRELVTQVKSEVEILSKFDHKNIIKLIDFQDDGEQLILVLEYCQISLEDLIIISSQNQQNINIQTYKRLFLQLLEALIQTEGMNIIHRDVKPSNIMIQTEDSIYKDYSNQKININQLLDQSTCKLVDFGVAKDITNHLIQTRAGSIQTMAPEVAMEQPYGIKADIYSLGCVFYWLLTQSYPCDGFSQQVPIKYQQIMNLIMKMIDRNPENRKSFCYYRDEFNRKLIKVIAQPPQDMLPSKENEAQYQKQSPQLILEDYQEEISAEQKTLILEVQQTSKQQLDQPQFQPHDQQDNYEIQTNILRIIKQNSVCGKGLYNQGDLMINFLNQLLLSSSDELRCLFVSEQNKILIIQEFGKYCQLSKGFSAHLSYANQCLENSFLKYLQTSFPNSQLINLLLNQQLDEK